MTAARQHVCSDEEGRELYRLFREASRATLGAFRNFSESPHDLSVTDVRALLYLEQHMAGTGSIGELADELHSSLGWASRVADSLAKDGLIESVRDKRDRRLVHLKLTDKGLQTAHLLSASLQKPIAASLSEVSAKQAKVIGSFLRTFIKCLNHNGHSSDVLH